MAEPEAGGNAALIAEQLGGLLRVLEEPQRRRAEEYARLSASFHQLLKDGDELSYRRTLAASTASFQTSSSEALRAAGSEGRFSWQQPAIESDSGLAGMQQVDNKAGCGCGASKAQEPTEEEFNGAMKEATRELQAAVTDINSILEELQYIKEDLQ